jgi:large conductance mechanosensitive channel
LTSRRPPEYYAAARPAKVAGAAVPLFSRITAGVPTIMSFASEFKEFALKGNVVDLAVGVIIGAAFGKIVDSIVKDLIMPIVGRIFGGLDFSNNFVMLASPPAGYNGPMTYEALTKAGVPLFAYGNFITVAINFIILAFIIFLMIKQINRLKLAEPITPPPAATPEDVLLLREIRDSLRK